MYFVHIFVLCLLFKKRLKRQTAKDKRQKAYPKMKKFVSSQYHCLEMGHLDIWRSLHGRLKKIVLDRLSSNMKIIILINILC